MVLWLRRLKTQEAFEFVQWNCLPLALHQLGEGAALEGWSTHSLRMSPSGAAPRRQTSNPSVPLTPILGCQAPPTAWPSAAPPIPTFHRVQPETEGEAGQGQ